MMTSEHGSIDRKFKLSKFLVDENFIKTALNVANRNSDQVTIMKIYNTLKSRDFTSLLNKLEEYCELNNINVEKLLQALVVIVFEYLSPKVEQPRFGVTRQRAYIHTNNSIPDRLSLDNYEGKRLVSSAIAFIKDQELNNHFKNFLEGEFKISQAQNEYAFSIDDKINTSLNKLLDQITKGASVG